MVIKSEVDGEVGEDEEHYDHHYGNFIGKQDKFALIVYDAKVLRNEEEYLAILNLRIIRSGTN